MPILYSKDRKSLQFPTNCDGYLQIAYPTSHQNVGIWGHEGSFTLEMIVTPYDVNGNSDTSYNGTIKSLGQGAKGLDYFPEANRSLSKMTLFHNTNLSVYLDNTTTGTSNQPAEYRIMFELTIGSTTTTLSSDTVIATTILDESSNDPTNYRYDKHTPTQRYVSGAWVALKKEALYVEVPHHIAVSYNASGGRMNIFYEGNLVKAGTHGTGGDFSLAESDIYIGQEADLSSLITKRWSQFMGEYHEMVFINKYKSSIGSTNTLTPFYGDVLLYFDFEEANLNG